MKATKEKDKAKGKGLKAPGNAKPTAKGSALDPCDKPQAAEAARLRANDEACDDGVK
jgi:hypothetical protein